MHTQRKGACGCRCFENAAKAQRNSELSADQEWENEGILSAVSKAAFIRAMTWLLEHGAVRAFSKVVGTHFTTHEIPAPHVATTSSGGGWLSVPFSATIKKSNRKCVLLPCRGTP